MIFDTTTRKLQVVLAAPKTTNDCPAIASWADITASTFIAGHSSALTNGVTAIDVIPAPAASTQRKSQYVSVYNADTVPTTVIVQYYDGGTSYQILKTVLAPTDTLQFTPDTGWNLTNQTTSTVTSIQIDAGALESGLIHLVSGTGVSLVDSPAGTVTFNNTGITGVKKTGGSTETGLITFSPGSNITITDSPAGTFTIASTASGGLPFALPQFNTIAGDASNVAVADTTIQVDTTHHTIGLGTTADTSGTYLIQAGTAAGAQNAWWHPNTAFDGICYFQSYTQFTGTAPQISAGGTSSGLVIQNYYDRAQYFCVNDASANPMLLLNSTAHATGINGTPATNLALDVQSTTQAFAPPRMTNTQMLAIVSPSEGMMVYDLTNHKMCAYDGGTWQPFW